MTVRKYSHYGEKNQEKYALCDRGRLIATRISYFLYINQIKN